MKTCFRQRILTMLKRKVPDFLAYCSKIDGIMTKLTMLPVAVAEEEGRTQKETRTER